MSNFERAFLVKRSEKGRRGCECSVDGVCTYVTTVKR